MFSWKHVALQGGLACAGVDFILFAYKAKWRYLWAALFGREPKALPFVKRDGSKDGANPSPVPIILLHGMWHDPTYYESLQNQLASRGYTSYALSLLPGERFYLGGTQREVVADLEATISALGIREFVLLGHSQGGLVAQSALRDSAAIRAGARGVVLLGTMPLGMLAPPKLALKVVLGSTTGGRSMYLTAGMVWSVAFGTLMNAAYTKHIFLMPDTDETTPEMVRYFEKIMAAPADGFITQTHVGNGSFTCNTPALILGADGDVIYPPVTAEYFDERFPNSTHVIAKGQAHCFVDPGWEKSMAAPLIDWMDTHMNKKSK